jgi:1-acyl-sn-glycerol-3-phosphate acyltransferase
MLARPMAERLRAETPQPTRPDRPEGRRPGERGRVLAFGAARLAIVGFFRVYWRVRISGREHIPATGPVVVAPIHRSGVDFVLAGMVTRRRVRFLVKHTVWRYPFLGSFLAFMGAIAVERGTADRVALRAVEDALRAGEPVVIFPEGTRQSGDAVAPLFDGVAYVAGRTGAPIIPVGIGSSAAALPPGSRLIAPARVTVVVGPPLPPLPTADGRVARSRVRQQTAALAAALQAAFDEARGARP